MRLDYRDARPIYVQSMDTFRREISAGVLRQEEKLPSVRELAAELSINPNTISRAYRQLEMEGWIATVPGTGRSVQGIPGKGPDGGIFARREKAAGAGLYPPGADRPADRGGKPCLM